MMKKIIGILIVTLMIASVFGTVESMSICEESHIDTIDNFKDQSTQRTVYLGEGIVMGNGNCDECRAISRCKDVGDIQCCAGEPITFEIKYTIDCWGTWDWGRVIAKVNGVTKNINTESNVKGHWTWDIPCYSGKVEWSISTDFTDGWPVHWCEKHDFCSGSLDFILPDPDLECDGSLSGTFDSEDQISGSFTVYNIEPCSKGLNWAITEWPSWGSSSWSFSPSSGTNLKATDGPVTVKVSVKAPEVDDKTVFNGYIKVNNKDESSDSDTIPVSITVKSRNRAINTPSLNFLQNHPMLFQLLQRFLKL